MDESLEAVTRGMEGEKREVFERVWRRVMHSGAAEDVPLAAEPAVPAPEVPALAAPPADRPEEDCPPAPGVLGEACLEHAGLLQGLIRGALEGWRTYQALARRTGGGPGRVLAALGAEEKRRAKELGAAYFLSSGVRCWPDPEKVPVPASYLGALRTLFRREQETVAACLAGAEVVGDPCLRELLVRHARQAWDRSCKIRGLIEGA